ncbi:MAG: hypothetical protein AMXMBFR25_09690 [Lysobacterales bacterium]
MSGALVCVGTGMLLGGHLTPRARHEIEQADIVHAAVSDGLVELWLRELNPRFESLQPFYREGQSRRLSYEQMVEALLASARAGLRTCGAFYGHPGVFAWVPHEAVRRARAEGMRARLEPGISAEDCLYADLGLDPGEAGCQHHEASQFLLYRRRIDCAAWLVLWQVGVVGDRSLARFQTGAAYRRLLLEALLRDYPPTHEVIVYRAATLPLEAPRIERLPLAALPQARVELPDTLVLPPAEALRPDLEMRARLDALDRSGDGA